MTPDGEDQRHHPRLPVACRVELHDRFATWAGETADVGPRGCQLLTSRAPAVGALVELAIASEQAPAPLEVVGQVTWVLPGPSTRAGISFLGRIEGKRAGPVEWFFGILGQGLARAACGEASSPLADLMVYLGAPPALEVLAPADRKLFCCFVGEGVRLVDLADICPSEVAMALLRRGWLTLVRSSAVAPERWLLALARVAGSGSCVPIGRMSGGFAKAPPTGFEGISEQARPTELNAIARGFIDRAVDALLERDLFLADQLMRRALAAAPGDAAVSAILRRIGARSVAGASIRLAAPGRPDGERANGCDRASGS